MLHRIWYLLLQITSILAPLVTTCTNVHSYFNLIYWDQNEILRRLVTRCTALHWRPIHKNQNITVIALHLNIHLHWRLRLKQSEHLQVTSTRPPYWVMISTIVHSPLVILKEIPGWWARQYRGWCILSQTLSKNSQEMNTVQSWKKNSGFKNPVNIHCENLGY